MKASEIRELSMEELRDRLTHLREDYFNLKFQHATGQLENPMRLPETKKDIARLMSVLREKELAL
ncbi:50S ribosomal protein L29 [Desulfocarbo indianensis]|nr:50S ribosomal protein L29 [Desulfocarbo indianensis]